MNHEMNLQFAKTMVFSQPRRPSKVEGNLYLHLQTISYNTNTGSHKNLKCECEISKEIT